MEYKKGDRVRHPRKHDWGLGEVLTDSNGDEVKIFFVGAGERTLKLNIIQPVILDPCDASHPVLDNLKLKQSTSGIKYRSLPESIQLFLEQFPQGFYGTRFMGEEREYKDKAHNLAEELIGENALKELIENEEYLEIKKRASRIVSATNLIFKNEIISFNEGLDSAEMQKLFSHSLFALLYSNDDIKVRFENFSRLLEDIDAAKWTTATYFLFIVHPGKYMFVKPTITRYFSELCGFEINYNPQPNWLTYKRVLQLSNYIFSELAELNPRDMIDVQSFMWCVATKVYQDV